MDVEVKLPDFNHEGKTVDPVEYGRLLHAVETIAKQMERWPSLETGLQKCNEDIRTLTASRASTDAKLEELITHVKHLNGTDTKLERLGFRLEDAKEHRKDQLHLRNMRRRDESRRESWRTATTRVGAAILLASVIWIASTLWQARHTLPLAS